MINYNIREKKIARIFLPREKNTRKYAKKNWNSSIMNSSSTVLFASVKFYFYRVQYF